ncbi:Lrp/AsnC family transcriptional regulator [Desulfurococcus mucosus]|uniref:Transcriptional regulator, AsnC family n=1 Tax=Desulfurococcus mucosus (strain ATCC 35584 / DSM 2162 / JCM 9187 / O7/1) TaxID=765177 RepID=E8R7J1_DESM0|nr:Lrp/AsnC family transcriptional regulator [Desulfurococcus mucosus]ADV64486.1 transcriptional regulator, AsnC family [Desulfurococcus mucosus DSM 2162]
MSYVKMDELDREVLKALQEDSRQSLRSIAERLGRPVSTVHERVRRLIDKGVLKGFTVLVDYGRLGYTVKALILMNVDGKHIIDVERHVSQHPNVLVVYDITGEFDVAVIAVFKEIRELDEFIKWILQNPYVKQTRTSIVFRTIKESIHLPLK